MKERYRGKWHCRHRWRLGEGYEGMMETVRGLQGATASSQVVTWRGQREQLHLPIRDWKGLWVREKNVIFRCTASQVHVHGAGRTWRGTPVLYSQCKHIRTPRQGTAGGH